MLLKITNCKKKIKILAEKSKLSENHHKSNFNFKVIIEHDGKTIHLLGSFKDHNYYNKANMPI